MSGGEIFITGDVHNRLPGSHAGALQPNEVSLAKKYVELAEEEGVNVTLFLTGKAILENLGAARELSKRMNLELGGHGWDSFVHTGARAIWWSVCGSEYGPKWRQAREIRNTINTFNDMLQVNISSWRNHAYYTDENTYQLLRKCGITVVSDRVTCDSVVKRSWSHEEIVDLPSRLKSVPINTITDHDFLLHGGIRQTDADAAAEEWRAIEALEFTKRARRNTAIIVRRALRYFYEIDVQPWSGVRLFSGTSPKMMSAHEWERCLMMQIDERIEKVGFACLLLHPACMEVMDGMATLRRIFKYCRRFTTSLIGSASVLSY